MYRVHPRVVTAYTGIYQCTHTSSTRQYPTKFTSTQKMIIIARSCLLATHHVHKSHGTCLEFRCVIVRPCIQSPSTYLCVIVRPCTQSPSTYLDTLSNQRMSRPHECVVFCPFCSTMKKKTRKKKERKKTRKMRQTLAIGLCTTEAGIPS